jgi:predicted dehydrogenase
MSKNIRWGILATGTIAKKFAEGLSVLPDAELVAVASRSQAGADKFGDEFNVPRRHASYEALANDPDVDVIYVATPHSMHRENNLLCLRAGKPVLCEKPFTINQKEAREVVALAREKGLFLMEGMWTRFIPAVVKARELIAAGAIGDVRMVQSTFGFRAEPDEAGRLTDPALGGGSLLDVGVYPIAFSYMIFGGKPERVVSMAGLNAENIDEQAAFLLGYSGGRIAVCTSAVSTVTPYDTFILGTTGMIKVHPPFWCSERISILREDQPDEVFDCPLGGNGFNHEAAAVMQCLREGKLEHPSMPLDETLDIMGTMDEIRAQWGLKYPME